MEDIENKENGSKVGGRGISLDHPPLSIEAALDVSRAIQTCGGHVSSYKTLSEVLNTKGGALNWRITSARRYGLIKGKGNLFNTELAERILRPVTVDEEKQAIQEAILSVPLFKAIFDRFGKDLPSSHIFTNILIREYKIPDKAIPKLISALKKNFKKLGLEANSQSHPHVSKIPIPQQAAKTDGQFPISITSKYGVFQLDITDGIDWNSIDAYIKSLKKKWHNERSTNNTDPVQQENE